MNRPIVMAQLGGATPVQAQAVRTIKLAKPADNQAQTVFLGYDQKFKLDLSAIANEKITFVHVGERLIILFDNQSTLTIDPFFDSAGAPRNNIAFDVNGREIDGSQFAATFPITNDQSVLPAAGDAAGGSPASGANFGDATVDPFGARTALDLLGQEELGTFVINDLIGQLIENFLPEVSANDDLVLDEDGLAGGNLAGLGDLDPATNGPVTLAGTLAHDYGNDDAGSLLLLGTDAPNGFTYILNGAGTVLTVIQNQDGVDVEVLRITLADTTSGNYTIEHLNAIRHAAADNENDQTFVFNYRVTDSNGDSVDGTLNLTVDDDTPTVAANPPVQLDDESASLPYDLPNAGGTGDADPDTANLAGTLALSFGADGGSVEWLADVIFTGGAAGLTAEVDPVTGALLIIQDQSGTAVTVLTVTLDASNGNYTVTHNAPMLHAPGDNENDQSFTLTYRVTDKDGDTADGTLTIDLDDDTPTIEVTVAEGEGSSEGGPGASLVLMPLDESIGDDSSDFDADFDDVPGNTTPDPTGTNPIGRTGTFVPPGGGQGQIGMLFNVTASPGVDGAQSITQVVSLTLTGSVGGPGVATTLTNTALAGVPSDTIYLFQISETEVVGVVGSDPAGDVALRITLLNPNDPAAAQLVVEQYLPIDHGADGNDFDSSLAMTLAEPGSSLGLTLTATVIDNDGDPATSSATIVFADQETSSVNIQDDGPSFNADAAAVARRVEEDAMTLPSAGNEGGNGHPDTQDGNKQAGDNSNQDQRSGPSGSLSPLVNFGTDGPAANGGFSITMTQSVLDALPTLYSGGAPVAYSSTGSILTAIDSNGQVVFTLTVNADGSWKFDLDGQLDHVDDAPNGENFRLRTDAAGTTSVPNIDFSSIIVATDGDGDSITGLAPGKFRIRVEDDVPTIVPPGGDAGANLITNGSFETGHGLANNDYDTFLSIPGWTAGDNGTPGDPNDDVPFEIQVGSTIGDLGPQDGQAKAELDSDLVGTGADGNPTGFTNATMQQTVGGTVAGQLYELSFYYSTRPSDGDAGSSSFEVLWNGAVVYTVDSTGVPVGWQHITLSLIATGPDSVLAFRATGQENSLGAYIDNVSLVAQAAAVVDEDGLSGPYSVGNNDSAPGDDTAGNGDGDDNEATATGSLGIVWGADAVDAADVGTTALGGLVQDTVDAAGDRSVVFTSATPTISGIAGPLTSHGDTLSYALTDGGTRLVATAPDGREVFEVTLSDDGSGRFRFVLNDQLDHAPGQSENNLALAFGYTATDSDSDSVTGSFVISIDDDMPTLADVAPIIRTVDEDDIRTPWSTGTSPNDGAGDGSITENSTGAAFISGSLTSLVSIGADEFPAGNENPIFGFVDGIAGQMTALGLYSKHSAQPATENGLPLTYQTSTDGDWVVLSAFEPDTPAPGNTGNPVFELRVNQLTGDYEFRLFDELMHQLPAGFPNSADENFVLRSGADGFVDAIDFGSFITVTDFDDDQITLNGQFQIQIRDDIPDPDIVVNPLGVVQHDETPGVQFILDSDTNESTVKALFADLEASGNVGDDLDVSGDTNGGVAGNGAIGYAQSVFSIVSASDPKPAPIRRRRRAPFR
jgi:T1SS-143 domain-containing protein